MTLSPVGFQPRFSGTTLINSYELAKHGQFGNAVLPEWKLPGYRHWTNSVEYHTGTLYRDGKPTLTAEDNAIAAKAQAFADTYLGGKVDKVMYQTPVELTGRDAVTVAKGLFINGDWTAHDVL